MENNKDEFSIKDLFNIVKPKILPIVIISVLIAAFAFIYASFLVKDTYTSSSLMHTSRSSSESDLAYAEHIVESYKYIIKGDECLTKIIMNMPTEYQALVSVPYLKSAISITNIKDGFFRISVTTTNQKLSYEIAKSCENIIPSEILYQLDTALPVQTKENAKLVLPNSKGEIKTAAVAFLLSAVVLTVAVFLFSFNNMLILDKENLEDAVDAPVLGVISIHKPSASPEENGGNP